jgi:hypothetical protein
MESVIGRANGNIPETSIHQSYYLEGDVIDTQAPISEISSISARSHDEWEDISFAMSDIMIEERAAARSFSNANLIGGHCGEGENTINDNGMSPILRRPNGKVSQSR